MPPEAKIAGRSDPSKVSIGEAASSMMSRQSSEDSLSQEGMIER